MFHPNGCGVTEAAVGEILFLWPHMMQNIPVHAVQSEGAGGGSGDLAAEPVSAALAKHGACDLAGLTFHAIKVGEDF